MSFRDKGDSFSVYTHTFNQCSVTWKIASFSKIGHYLNQVKESPQFLYFDALWEVGVFPYGTSKLKGVVSIYLRRMGCKYKNEAYHIVSAKFTVPRSGGQGKSCEFYGHVFKDECDRSAILEILSLEEVLKNNSGYLENGTFTIKCEMIVEKNIYEHHKEEILPEEKDAKTNKLPKEVDTCCLCDYRIKDDIAALLTDMEALHLNPSFADVTLKVGTHEFPAHKVVLRNRSKVFNAMFEHDMKENQQDTVSLFNVEPDTLKILLRYIYCGKMHHLSFEEALSFYIAADKYDVQGLVIKCRQVVLKELSIDNISEVATFADLHNDQFLMDSVKSFLYGNMKEIFMTEKWMMFSKENQTLSLNLIHSADINN